MHLVPSLSPLLVVVMGLVSRDSAQQWAGHFEFVFVSHGMVPGTVVPAIMGPPLEQAAATKLSESLIGAEIVDLHECIIDASACTLMYTPKYSPRENFSQHFELRIALASLFFLWEVNAGKVGVGVGVGIKSMYEIGSASSDRSSPLDLRSL